MVKFNLLTEGFVKNISVSGAREVEPDEMDLLLSLDGTSSLTTVSGDIISLQMDLGFLHSVNRLRYKTTPLDLANTTIQYGRELNNLTTASPSVVGGEIIVEPTASGFTHPRYFTLTHNITQSGLVLDRLIVENTDEEINFGEDGSLSSVTITSPITEGVSDIKEIYVLNSGTIPSDIFVTVDTSRADIEVFNNLEISPTITGTFQTVDPNNVPNNIPWQWGVFENCLVNDDNELEIFDPNLAGIGSSWNPSISSQGGYRQRGIGAKDNDGNLVIARMAPNNGDLSDVRIHFIDPVNRIFSIVSPALPYTVTDTITELENQHLAYDGEDNLYWIRGSSTQTGGSDQELYKYNISSNTISLVDTFSTLFNGRSKGLIYDPVNNNLHILAGNSTPQTNSTDGTLHHKYDLDTNTLTPVMSLPFSVTTRFSARYFEGYIYIARGFSLNDLARYRISNDSWSILSSPPVGSAIDAMAINENTRELWAVVGDDGGVCGGSSSHAPTILPLDLDTLSWGDSFVLQCGFFGGTASTIQELDMTLDGVASFFTNNSSSWFKTQVLSEVPITIEGEWLSPVFLIRQGVTTSGTGDDEVVISGLDSFHRFLIDRIETEDIFMTIDENITIETFEIRSSSQSPAGDNTVEDFTTSGVDTTRHVTGSTGGVFLEQNDPFGLQFSHVSDSDITATFLYLNQQFATTGKMQYKFWWKPPQSKSGSGSQENRTSVYIVPFLDTLNTGSVPIRDEDTLRRNNGDYIALRLGDESNTNTFTQISVFKGGGGGSGAPNAGTDDYTITATSSNYYEVVFLLNWETGDYTLRFGGEEVGNGNIPIASRLLFQPLHSMEIYSSSTGTGTAFDEYFRHLTVSRINLEARQDFSASPLHLEDPLFGLNGSLPFIPVTVNSAVFPVEDYVQLKLKFKATTAFNKGLISRIAFPPIIRLPDVQPGQAKPVYVRYNFPASKSLLQEEIYLKAYMTTDKE